MALTDAEESAVAARVVQLMADNAVVLGQLAREKGTAVPDARRIEVKAGEFIAAVQKVKDAKVAWDKSLS